MPNVFRRSEEHYKLKYLGNGDSKSYSSVAECEFTHWNMASCNARHFKGDDV